ncbi:hypothetical protein [Actinocorallia sp. A-T 12471]|uniref:hypothetical protein n=1 Tax=Actinocorallia sp. A-T 12471 TaxID=3089813 RepID=UPI0029CB68AF|nr:hypothetical protein [Actinocorallia sp. A-T 12471]MDX6745083.1 hypothetical protein [Actinocorallia sp. A-T 12471]
MSIDPCAEGGRRSEETPVRLSPLPSLHETFFELLRIEIDKHPHMGVGVVPRDGRKVLFVVHGETGRLADIDITVLGDTHWYTWAAGHTNGRTIGTPAEAADVASVIVKTLAEAGRPNGAV